MYFSILDYRTYLKDTKKSYVKTLSLLKKADKLILELDPDKLNSKVFYPLAAEAKRLVASAKLLQTNVRLLSEGTPEPKSEKVRLEENIAMTERLRNDTSDKSFRTWRERLEGREYFDRDREFGV